MKVGSRVRFHHDESTRHFASNGEYYPPEGTLGVVLAAPRQRDEKGHMVFGSCWQVRWANGRESGINDLHIDTVLETITGAGG